MLVKKLDVILENGDDKITHEIIMNNLELQEIVEMNESAINRIVAILEKINNIDKVK